MTWHLDLSLFHQLFELIHAQPTISIGVKLRKNCFNLGWVELLRNLKWTYNLGEENGANVQPTFVNSSLVMNPSLFLSKSLKAVSVFAARSVLFITSTWVNSRKSWSNNPRNLYHLACMRARFRFCLHVPTPEAWCLGANNQVFLAIFPLASVRAVKSARSASSI